MYGLCIYFSIHSSTGLTLVVLSMTRIFSLEWGPSFTWTCSKGSYISLSFAFKLSRNFSFIFQGVLFSTYKSVPITHFFMLVNFFALSATFYISNLSIHFWGVVAFGKQRKSGWGIPEPSVHVGCFCIF